MSCTCEIEIDHDGGPTFYSGSDPVARKPHKCCECRRTIQPGERYERVSGLWDGDFEEFKTCYDCVSMRSALFCTYCFGSLWSDLADDLAEHDGQINFSCLPGMTPAARARVIEMVEQAWSDHCRDGSPEACAACPWADNCENREDVP